MLRKGIACFVAGAALAWLPATQAQPKDEKKIPEIESTAPKISEPAPAPVPAPPLPPADGFSYSGSPLNLFTAPSTGGTGAPESIFDLPRAITVLDSSRINERVPATTPEILQNLPGVTIQRTNMGGGSLILRGRNGNQNLIMVDGIPINDAGWRFANVQYLNTIDPGAVERVEVIRGASSVLYGSGALGGVVNFVTKGRKDFSQEMDVGGGIITRFSSASQEPYNRVEIQGNARNLGYFVGGSYLSSGSLFAGNNVTFPEPAAGYDQRAMDVKVNWLLGEDWVATFAFQHLMQPSVPRTDRFPLPQVDPVRFVNQPTVTDQERNFGYLRLARYSDTDVISGLEITLALQQRREVEDITTFRANGTFNDENIGMENVLYGGIDIRAYSRFSENHTLTYGATYWHHTVDARRFRRTGSRTATLSARTPTLPPDGEYDETGLFLLDSITPVEWLKVYGGVRYSHIRATGTAGFLDRNQQYFEQSFDDWSGEFGIVVALTDNLHWVGGIREGFRAPNLEDLATSDKATGRGPDFGAVTIQGENVTSFETGFKYLSEYFQFNATYYYDNLETQIVRFREAGANTRINTTGLMHGVELEGVVFLSRNLSTFASASQVYGQDTTLNEPLSRIPPAWLAVGARYADRGPRMSWFVEGWVDMADRQDRYSTADKADIRFPVGGNPAWQTVNVRGGIDTGAYGKLTLGVYNLFDQNYRVIGSGVDAPGIDARLGYELTF